MAIHVSRIDSSTDLEDRYSNLFLNAYINRHAHTEYLKMIEVYDCGITDHIHFLAHLSRRLMVELIVYQSLRRPSVVCRLLSVVFPSTISNIFFSETTGPIKLKLHMKTP